MIKLTSWEDGTPIYVHREWIMSIYRLPASNDISARTRVDTVSDGCHLVTELPDDIYRQMILYDLARAKGMLDAIQRFENSTKGS